MGLLNSTLGKFSNNFNDVNKTVSYVLPTRDIAESVSDSGDPFLNASLSSSSGTINKPTVASSTPSAKSVVQSSAVPTADATTSVSGVVQPSYQDILDQVSASVDKYNAQAQANAEAQWKFNSEEAQKNRDWQEYMSNTAHQREVADLLAAGLNPVLSAGGTGAAVTSGSSASGSQANVSDSLVSVFGNYLNTLINSATAISQANINAKASENVASMYNAMNYKIKQDFPDSLGQLMARYYDGFMGATTGTGSARGVGEALGNFIVDILRGVSK